MFNVISLDEFGTVFGTQEALFFLKTRKSEADILFRNTWALTLPPSH